MLLFFSFLSVTYALDPEDIDSWMESVPLLTIGDQFCSGILIDKKTIATAYHCIASGRNVLVEWEDGTQTEASIFAADARSDLALLRMNPMDRKERAARPIRSTAVRRGEAVLALGHPFAPFASGKYTELLRWSLSRGIVSKVGDRLIQTDTPLNPGNSGGALVDEQGNIMGIVSHKFRAEGLSFASSSTALIELQENPKPLSLIGGAWAVYPSLSMGIQSITRPSFDINASSFIRDRVHLQLKGRLYWNVMEELTNVGALQQYPISLSTLGRLRLGKGTASIVLEGGLSILQETSLKYEEEQYSEDFASEWGWVAQIATGGVTFRLEGIPSESIFLIGLSIDSLGFRGVF